MNANTTAGRLTRNAVVLATMPIALVMMSGTASATEGKGVAKRGDTSSPQPLSNADRTGNGANPGTLAGCGAYCSTRDGSASQNGRSDNTSSNKPCAGCVGKADNKNPRGQAPSGPVDHNAGYECDRNQGIGQGNPAHTGCTTPTTPPVTPPVTTPPVTPPVTTPPVTPPGTPPVVTPPVTPPGNGGGNPTCTDGSVPTGPNHTCTPAAPVTPGTPAAPGTPAPGTPGTPATPGNGGTAPCAADATMPAGSEGTCAPGTPTTPVTPGTGVSGNGSTPTVITVGGSGGSVTAPPAGVTPSFGSGTLSGPTAGAVSFGPTSLPLTGGNSQLIALAGLVLLGTGGGLVLAGRRS